MNAVVKGRRGRRVVRYATCALTCAAIAVSAAGASAAPVAHPHNGGLPGFPHARGVIPVLSSQAAIARHAEAVRNAAAEARSRHATPAKGKVVPNDEFGPCKFEPEKERTLATSALCYRGGPVLHDPTVYVIFWQGPLVTGQPENPKVSLFPGKFEEVIEHYLEGVSTESGHQSNIFAIDPQYFEVQGTDKISGEYRLASAPGDAVVDNRAFPSHSEAECADKTRFTEGPCLLDSDIQHEVKEVATEKSWPQESLGAVYLVITPAGVGGCFEAGACALQEGGYCAYHGDFGGDGMTVGQQTLYADLPYDAGVSGCVPEPEVHPNQSLLGSEAAGADADIDDISHELNEAITDPIGSQCDEESPEHLHCEPTSWLDESGQELADKCLPTETPPGSVYGEPLGEALSTGTEAEKLASRYNQVIAGHDYWTQRQWSNEAGGYFQLAGKPFEQEGACVQRMLGVPVPSISPGPAASVPTAFNVSASAVEGMSYWIWNFGDGEQVGSASPTMFHTYAVPGEYEATVTGYDAYGSSRGDVFRVRVGAAPPAPQPAVTTTTVTASAVTTVTKSLDAPVAHYTSAQLAAKLGLPRAGARLAGLGTITFGHGACPPACLVSGRLVTRVRSVSHRRHVTRTGTIGTVSITIAHGGTGTIALRLNAAGRSLLRSHHQLSVQLVLAVTGLEGAVWPITRSFTLTSAGGKKSARRRR